MPCAVLYTRLSVAPRVGAWIETLCCDDMSLWLSVAPRVGAWIETLTAVPLPISKESRPVWARGLKHSKGH